MYIGKYQICVSNGSQKQEPCVTVKLDGVVLGRVYTEGSNALHTMCRWPLCKDRQALTEQLQANSVPEVDIAEIFTPRRKATNRPRVKITTFAERM